MRSRPAFLPTSVKTGLGRLTAAALARSSWRTSLAALAAALAIAAPAAAQTFPDRTVRVIVPFPPGGATDIAARLVSDQLSKIWAQPVVVENRSGASGLIGAEAAARAKPDGYTLLIGTIATNVVAHLLKSDVPYGRDAFEPITILTSTPNILLANDLVPGKTIPDLVAYAKANPGKVRYASAGVGLSGHLGVELFADKAGLNLVHIPYRGSAPSVQGFTGREGELTLALVPEASKAVANYPFVKPLAIAAAKRSPKFPDTPTFAEIGYPSVQVYAINSLMAPEGTPQPIIDKIWKDAVKALNDPEARSRMDQIGLDVVGNSPKEFEDSLKEEFARWEPLISANRDKFK